MKITIYATALLLTFTTITFSQSVMNYQAGTAIQVQTGASICADSVVINGALSGGGTICGFLYALNVSAFIEGFYNSISDNMIGDTVRVYLRNATNPYTLVDSSKSTLSSSGVGTFYFSNVIGGANYYIVLKHRNSIETWSDSGKAFSSGTLTFNFTTAANKAYGNNQSQVDFTPAKFAIYSGDVNQDGIVDGTDALLIDNGAANFLSGYLAGDVNGDNFIDGSDALIADNNAANFVSVVRP